jgi:hypothetical protein
VSAAIRITLMGCFTVVKEILEKAGELANPGKDLPPRDPRLPILR